MRMPSMEALGFIDAPPASWTTPPSAQIQEAVPAEPSQTTGLVALPNGKHTRRIEPTGELVRDMWESTELHAPSLLDWVPQGFSSTTLARRNFRWPMLALFVVVAFLVAGFGYWIYRQPASAAATAMAGLRTEAVALHEELNEALPLVTGLDEERLPAANQDSTVFFDMGERARAMFAASADLPASGAVDRTAAAEAAGLAIDASRQLMDATAFRTALEPALTLPILETDPDLTDLGTAAQAFGEWWAGFESVREALPTGVAGRASMGLEELSAGLEATQTTYLDALRTDDQPAAVEALGMLRAELQAVRYAMLTDMAEVSASVTRLVEGARTKLDHLLG